VAAKHFLFYGVTMCYRNAGMHQLAGILNFAMIGYVATYTFFI